jgi:tRNA-specific adenosine deaminase 3
MIMRSLIVCALFTGLASAHLGATTAAASPPIPDAGGAVEAFFAARSWLDRGGPGDAPIATPRDVRSAAVVLRFRGRVVGKGEDAGDGAEGVAPGPAGTPGNAGPLDRALRRALVDVRARGATSVAGIDARPDPRTLTLELELAGERQPLIGRTFAEIARTIEPAECGLQIADGERTAYAPAADLLARRMAAPTSRAIVAMVGELGLPARDLPDLQSLGGATAVYGSWGVRLAQRAPEDPPIALARILPPVSMAPATRAESQAVADAVVARIERRHKESKRSQQLHEPDPAAAATAAAAKIDHLCNECDVYVTAEPCAMCAMAMVHSRVRRVVYALPVAGGGALGSLYRLHAYRSLNHHFQVVRGMLQHEAEAAGLGGVAAEVGG